MIVLCDSGNRACLPHCRGVVVFFCFVLILKLLELIVVYCGEFATININEIYLL